VTGDKKCILLVDSDTFILSCLGGYLVSVGFEVLTADSAEKALKYLGHAEPDLIILEINLSGMGGIGFIGKVSEREGHPKYPILVFTVREELDEFCRGLGVAGFLPKKAYGDQLGRMITDILGRPVPPRDEPVESRPKRILLVEDDSSVAGALARMLKESDCTVLRAANGPDAVKCAAAEKPDAVLIKEMLPGMNGHTVCLRLAEMDGMQQTSVILYDETLRGEKTIMGPEPVQGAHLFLRTSDPREIFKRVRKILDLP